jgi:hypothetical protein
VTKFDTAAVRRVVEHSIAAKKQRDIVISYSPHRTRVGAYRLDLAMSGAQRV